LAPVAAPAASATAAQQITTTRSDRVNTGRRRRALRVASGHAGDLEDPDGADTDVCSLGTRLLGG
jgi:hypothetical protein